MEKSTLALCPLFLVLLWSPLALGGHDYGQALSKSILFFEAQRSGYLPSTQRVTWRANSGLSDGKASGVDLVGGYYDAGDNVKFGLPMAFTVTMMSWSILEYGKQMAAGGELSHAIDAVKWGTDYFIKAHPEPHVLYGEVGDGNTDHYCWQRPEDMTTDRKAYRIDQSNPGSDLAGETAAAMAAASIVFRHSNAAYSGELLRHAEQLFEFADKYRGKYDGSITVAQKYYRSISGYNDELLWAAAWLYQATNNQYYLGYLANNGDSLSGIGWGWDVKYAGVQTLVAKLFLVIIICLMSLHMYFAPPNAKAAPENLKELKDLPQHFLFYNSGGPNISTRCNLTTNSWLIDSGATSHCTAQEDIFGDDYEPVDNMRPMTVANGDDCKISGKGTVILEIPGGGRLVLKDTLYVPDLNKNIISTGVLDKDGYTTTFEGGEWKITRIVLIASGKLMNSLYHLEVNNTNKMTATPMHTGPVAKRMVRPQAKIRDWQAKITDCQAKIRDWEATITDCQAKIRDWEATITDCQAKITDCQAKITKIMDCQAKSMDSQAQPMDWQAQPMDSQAQTMDSPDNPSAGGVFLVSSDFPSDYPIKPLKDNGLVPIVEPKTLLDGDQLIERILEVAKPHGQHVLPMNKSTNNQSSFQMPLHYPRYGKKDYENMLEWKLDRLLNEYGLPVSGDVNQKRKFAMGAFLWPSQEG